MVSNLECAKLKLSDFAVKRNDCDPIFALYDTVATCYCISFLTFHKNLRQSRCYKKTL